MDPQLIGGPVQISSGPLAGSIFRAELQELQKADHARKYARKDRRPLDPPPVVQLKLTQVVRTDTNPVTERHNVVNEYDDLTSFGFLCHVDLFPLPARCNLDGPQGYPVVVPTDVIGAMSDHVLRESSKCTSMLSGAIVVSASTLGHLDKNTMMFIFSDIAVKAEGTFCLRYRAFNIFAAPGADDAIPVLAECFSGPFRVYSTKNFPGLRASTDLTKHISLNGVRLNSREAQRKRKRPSQSDDEASS